MRSLKTILLTCSLFTPALLAHAQAPIGQFQAQGDIGSVLHPGSATFDAASATYKITGSGSNMWFTADEFHFLYKKLTGNVIFSADITFQGTTGNPHRKAALILRQTLAPDSAYADVALHGDGLTSLQFRATTAAVTHEVETAATSPKRVRIERLGDQVSVFVTNPDGTLAYSGAALHLSLTGDFYVGLGVCSHDKDVSETALFSNVTIEPATSAKPILWSTLESVKIASTDRLVASTIAGSLSHPTWPTAAAPQAISGPGQTSAAEAPVPSPDGKWSASYSGSGPDTQLRLNSLADGTTLSLATFNRPAASGPPAWSPDSTRIAFISQAQIP